MLFIINTVQRNQLFTIVWETQDTQQIAKL